MTPPPAPSSSGDETESTAIGEWIERTTGHRPRALTPIAPGLGHRRFVRIDLGGDAPWPRLVLRIDPPALRVPVRGIAPEPELEPIRALLEAHALPVPRSHGRDAARGWDLLEDVGEVSLEQAVAAVDADTRMRLYRAALALVPRIQAISATGPASRRVAAFERRLDASLIASKARKLIEWLLPECLGREASAAEGAAVEAGFAAVAEAVEAAPRRLSHRDFKAANLHLRGAAPLTADAAVDLVLIDLQGAFLAPPEYDLVCLLRDSQVPLPDAEIDAHLEAVRGALPDRPSAQALGLRFDQLTLTRVGKDLSHYMHAAREQGDARYLGFVGTGLARLRQASERLAGEGPVWRDLAHLFADLPLPAACQTAGRGYGNTPSEASRAPGSRPCER